MRVCVIVHLNVELGVFTVGAVSVSVVEDVMETSSVCQP